MSVNYVLKHDLKANQVTVLCFPPPGSELHQAIAQFSIAEQLAPQNTNYPSSLASALDIAGDNSVAIVQWRKVLALLPQSPTGISPEGMHMDNAQILSGDYDCLAGDLAKTGALAEADQDYKAALYWEPSYDYERLEYAKFLNQHGRRSEARMQWHKIIAGKGDEASSAKAMLAKYPE